MSKKAAPYRRPHAERLARRVAEPRRFIQVVADPWGCMSVEPQKWHRTQS